MLTKTVTLKHGMTIEKKTYTSLVLREAETADLLDAEDVAPVTKRLQYNAALLAQTLVSAGDFQGPFTAGMLRQLKPVDFNSLQEALYELEVEAGKLPGDDGASTEA